MEIFIEKEERKEMEFVICHGIFSHVSGVFFCCVILPRRFGFLKNGWTYPWRFLVKMQHIVGLAVELREKADC